MELSLSPSDSLMAALSSCPDGPLTIHLAPGDYREKVRIARPDVTILAEKGARILFNDHHGTVRDGRAFSTGDSATLTIAAPGFQAFHLTVVNDFDYLSAKKYNSDHPERQKIDTQAVALRTIAGACSCYFEDCTFDSFQDTVYADSGLHEFQSCRIIGNVDFIFGAGTALFENCEIISRLSGIVVAPSTLEWNRIGFVFVSCHLSAYSSVEKDSVYLARPWHPSGSLNRICRAQFIDCTLDEHFRLEKWTSMNSRTPEGIEHRWFPEDSVFACFSSSESEARSLVCAIRKALKKTE